MMISAGRVVDGNVQVHDTPFTNGAVVAILQPEEEGFDLAPGDEQALLSAIREAETGEVVEGFELLRSLEK